MFSYFLIGSLAGSITGILGGGGGLVLVPLLSPLSKRNSNSPFQTSVCIMLPICFFTLLISDFQAPSATLLPYLFGGIIGGAAAVRLSSRIPVDFLHRILGAFMLWGGIRYLWL